MGRAVAGIAVGIVAVAGIGWIAINLLSGLISILAYLIVGALVIGGGMYVYGKVKRSVAPGTRNGYRLEAAKQTYRMRNR